MKKQYWTLESVTPEVAEEYLTRSSRNRPIMESRVSEYAATMRHGEWLLTHQGISFNESNQLNDGQHRLSAIVKAGVTVLVWVYRGLEQSAMVAVDDGKQRTVRDVGVISGMCIGTAHVAIAKKLLTNRGWTTGRISRPDLLAAIELHWDAISFAITACGHCRGVGNAAFAAVIARAWYTRDRNRLLEMVEIVKTGICDDSENSAAIRIRDLLMGRIHASSGQRMIYGKSQAAVLAFLERRSVSKLYERSEIIFPIPGDRQEGKGQCATP